MFQLYITTVKQPLNLQPSPNTHTHHRVRQLLIFLQWTDFGSSRKHQNLMTSIFTFLATGAPRPRFSVRVGCSGKNVSFKRETGSILLFPLPEFAELCFHESEGSSARRWPPFPHLSPASGNLCKSPNQFQNKG